MEQKVAVVHQSIHLLFAYQIGHYLENVEGLGLERGVGRAGARKTEEPQGKS